MVKTFELAGKIVEIGDDRYKIYHTNKDFAFMCKLDTSKLDLMMKPIAIILEESLAGECHMSNAVPSMEIDERKMTTNELRVYETRKAFMDDVEKTFGPDYIDLYIGDRSKEFRTIYKKHGISAPTAWKTVRLFLQAGRCDEGLIDRRIRHKASKKYNYTRKTGRPYMEGTVARGIVRTEEVDKVFETYTNKFLKNKSMTLKGAYELMIYNEFSYHYDDGARHPFPESERPTERQFYYYVSTKAEAKRKALKEAAAAEAAEESVTKFRRESPLL